MAPSRRRKTSALGRIRIPCWPPTSTATAGPTWWSGTPAAPACSSTSTRQWFVGLSDGTSQFQTSEWDVWNPAFTWADVQPGDFNGDGRDDLVGRSVESGQWWVALSDGAGHFTTSLWDGWSPNVTWAD